MDNSNRYYMQKTPSLENMLNTDDTTDMCKLSDIGSENGWKFSNLEMLNDIGFKIEDDYIMTCDFEIPSIDINNTDDILTVKVFKNKEGYNLKTDVRNYVFDTFESLISYFDHEEEQ